MVIIGMIVLSDFTNHHHIIKCSFNIIISMSQCHHLQELSFLLLISFPTRMSSSSSIAGSPLCSTCWNPGLPLWWQQWRHFAVTICFQLLLRSVWHWKNYLRPWLDHWIWILEANALTTLPCRRLWQRRWVAMKAAKIFLFPQVLSPHRTTLATIQTI